MVPAPVGFQCPECIREGNRTVRQPVSRYGGRPSRSGVVTYALIGINVAVFIATVLSAGSGRMGGAFIGTAQSSLFDRFALIPPAVAHGDVYRLLTAAFLHFGIWHIGFNMWALYVCGPPVEAALGRWRFLTLYLLAGLGGSVLTVAFASPASDSAGASGAIFGLFGAIWFIQRRIGQPSQAILLTIGINLIITFTVANISWEGHIGGLITGTALCAALLATAKRPPGRTQRHIGVFAAAAVLLAAGGFAGVHRVGSECANPADPLVGAFCQHYDPGSVTAITGRHGNVAAGSGVVAAKSSAPSASGGPHA